MSALSDAMEARGKATPTPWAVHPFHATVDGASKSGMTPICGMLWPTEERTEEETEANAAIIAAAPEALAWIAEAVDVVEYFYNVLDVAKSKRTLSIDEDIKLRHIESLLARAKGE